MFDTNYGEAIAILTDTNIKISYKELLEASIEIKQALPRGSLVLLIADNSFESILIYYSCIRHKIPLMILSHDTDDDQLDHIKSNYKPNFIFSKSTNTHNGYKLNQTISSLKDFKIFSQKKYESLNINDELLLMLSTSGSTGSIKFVRLSEKNIKSNSNSIASYLGLDKSDKAITTMPMSYTFGLSIITSHLDNGATIIATNKTVLDRDFWNLVDKHRVTSISGVPYLFEILIKTGFLKRNIASLRYITQAGGKLDNANKSKLISYCSDNKIDFYVMYGQTEATARMSYVPPSVLKSKIESIGIPIKDGKFFIDEYGEIIFEGPNVSLGYAKSYLDLSNGDDNKGRLHTGDIGYHDNDGYYFISGRTKRFAKIFGLRVSLDDVESILESNFFENEFLCTDSMNKLNIMYTNKLDEKELISFISKKLKLNKTAFFVKKINTIPRNNSGKKVYK